MILVVTRLLLMRLMGDKGKAREGVLFIICLSLALLIATFLQFELKM